MLKSKINLHFRRLNIFVYKISYYKRYKLYDSLFLILWYFNQSLLVYIVTKVKSKVKFKLKFNFKKIWLFLNEVDYFKQNCFNINQPKSLKQGDLFKIIVTLYKYIIYFLLYSLVYINYFFIL